MNQQLKKKIKQVWSAVGQGISTPRASTQSMCLLKTIKDHSHNEWQRSLRELIEYKSDLNVWWLLPTHTCKEGYCWEIRDGHGMVEEVFSQKMA